MKRWIAVATALVALLLVPSALAGGDDDRSDRGGSKAYAKHKGDHDGDKGGHGYKRGHDDDDDDDEGDRDYRKGDRDDHDDDDDDDDDDKGKDDRGHHQKPQDACPNIEGHQSVVPAILVKDARGSCIAPTVSVASVPVVQSAPAVAPALPSVVQVKPQATPKVKKKVKKKAKKAKRAKAKKAKRKLKRGVKSAGRLPRVLPFTR